MAGKKWYTVGQITGIMKEYLDQNDNFMPTIKQWAEYSKIDPGTICNYIGQASWVKTWLAVGAKEREVIRITELKSKMLDDIVAVYNKLDNKSNIHAHQLIRDSGHSLGSVYAYFYSIDRFFQAAGIRQNLVDKSEALEDFKTICEKLGRWPNKKELKKLGRFPLFFYFKHYESIENMGELVGFKQPYQPLSLTEDKDMLLEEAKQVISKLGFTPTAKVFFDYCKYSSPTYNRAFGGYTKLLGLLGLKQPKSNINKLCPVCSDEITLLIAHFEKSHPEELATQKKMALDMMLSGIAMLKIQGDDSTIFTKAYQLNKIKEEALAENPNLIFPTREQKIAATLKKRNEAGDFEHVKKINTARNQTSEARKKNSNGPKQAYKTGAKESWNIGENKETNLVIKAGTEKQSITLQQNADCGLVEYKLGTEHACFKPISHVRDRRHLNFSRREKAEIKARANYRC